MVDDRAPEVDDLPRDEVQPPSPVSVSAQPRRRALLSNTQGCDRRLVRTAGPIAAPARTCSHGRRHAHDDEQGVGWPGGCRPRARTPRRQSARLQRQPVHADPRRIGRHRAQDRRPRRRAAHGPGTGRWHPVRFRIRVNRARCSPRRQRCRLAGRRPVGVCRPAERLPHGRPTPWTSGQSDAVRARRVGRAASSPGQCLHVRAAARAADRADRE